jgi:hypothetical protein
MIRNPPSTEFGWLETPIPNRARSRKACNGPDEWHLAIVVTVLVLAVICVFKFRDFAEALKRLIHAAAEYLEQQTDERRDKAAQEKKREP